MLQNCSDKEAPHLKPSNQLLARTDTEQAINSKKELIGQSSRAHKCKAAARLEPWRYLGATDVVKQLKENRRCISPFRGRPHLSVTRVDRSCRSPGSKSWDTLRPSLPQAFRNTLTLSCRSKWHRSCTLFGYSAVKAQKIPLSVFQLDWQLLWWQQFTFYSRQ